MLNTEIETILNNFTVDGVSIPVNYMFYAGHGEPYIIYMNSDTANAYGADDEIQGLVYYYDFDIYATGNYFNIVKELRQKMTQAGWTWQPSRDSIDFFETDTKYFHKTICFAKAIQLTE